MFCGIINYLDALDRAVTVAFNFDGGSIADMMAVAVSSRYIWLPLGALFLYKVVVAQNRRYGVSLAIVLGLALVVTVCDQVSASVIKPYFARLRPSHDAEVSALLHYVGSYRGGLYGFVSSHAANAFGTAVYTMRFVKGRAYAVTVLAFSAFVGYSRVYLGVHYVGDVLCGAMLGVLFGYVLGKAVSACMRLRMPYHCRFDVKWPFVILHRMPNV